MEQLKNKKLSWCMTITFWVYMVHGNIQRCINKILGMVLEKYAFAGVLINIFLGVILTYLLAAFFAYLLKKYCNRAWKIVNGYR
jgi:peptidoglycan/LPS O-acetylase OafA/YrhL